MKSLAAGRGTGIRLGVALLCAATACAAPGEDALPIEPAREVDLLRAAGADFELKRTAHFLIAYDVRPEQADRLSQRLEATWSAVHRFCRQQGVPVRSPAHRLEVIFFNDQSAYERYSRQIGFNPQGTVGLYHVFVNRSAFFNIENERQMQELDTGVQAALKNLDALASATRDLPDDRAVVEIEFSDGRRERLSRREADTESREIRAKLADLDRRRTRHTHRMNQTVLQHEAAHQVLYNAGLHASEASNPVWLVEGLACLFETPPGARGAALGVVNELRLQDFREAVQGPGAARRPTPSEILDAMRQGRLASPRDLILQPELLLRPGTRSPAHYAAAWGLSFYLQRVHGAKLAAYLRAIARRPPGERADPQQELTLFEEQISPVDDAFLRRFSAFIAGLTRAGAADP